MTYPYRVIKFSVGLLRFYIVLAELEEYLLELQEVFKTSIIFKLSTYA